MIILIWFNTLMHFMHVVQMIFLLNVYMLIIKSTFYSLTSWIENLKIKSIKINKIIFISILNRAARKYLLHSFIITKFTKQLQFAFSIFDKIINFNWYHFFSFAIRRLF